MHQLYLDVHLQTSSFEIGIEDAWKICFDDSCMMLIFEQAFYPEGLLQFGFAF